MPTRAKALFATIASHAPSPSITPAMGPIERLTKKYVPPARGMAVASSALLRSVGTIRTAARR